MPFLDYNNALTAYTAIIDRFPNEANAYYMRGRTYEKLKDYQRAITDCTETIRLDPNFIGAYARRGLVLLDNIKDYDNAIADFIKAIGINQDDFTYYVIRPIPNRIYIEEDEVGILTVEASLRSNIDAPEWLYFWRVYHMRKKAILIRRLLTTVNRGMTYIGRGPDFFRNAQNDWNEVLKIDPNNDQAKQWLAVRTWW